MSLTARLEAARQQQTSAPAPPASSAPIPMTEPEDVTQAPQDAPVSSPPSDDPSSDTPHAQPQPPTLGTGAPRTVVRPPDALAKLKEHAREALYERLGARLTDTALTEEQLNSLVRKELTQLVADASMPLRGDERRRLIKEVTDDVLGYGPLQSLLDDESVTEIMVNGHEHIYVEHEGKLSRHPGRFGSEEHLRHVIERIVSRVGRRIDESSPLVDARLEDGSRVNAIIPPLAFGGSSLTIRKFGRAPLKVQDLLAKGSLSPQMVDLLRACVAAKLNVLVTGGTGTGKTTLLNVLSSFIPGDERIVTIEDAVELQLQQEHVVRLESRPRNIEGKGEVTIRDLVRNSLRMRPDRIIVGEVRGGESLDMLQAMNTGHEGSLSTLHANSPRDAVARLETMVLMAGMDLPLRAIREQIASAVDVIVHLTRLRDGSRRVTHVTEVQGMEGDIITLQDCFLFDYGAGVDPTGRFRGTTRATGVRPHFTDRFIEQGIAVPYEVFDADALPRGRR